MPINEKTGAGPDEDYKEQNTYFDVAQGVIFLHLSTKSSTFSSPAIFSPYRYEGISLGYKHWPML